MNDTAIIDFINQKENQTMQIEVPLDITANELIFAMNQIFSLGFDMENIYDCYLTAENHIAFLKGTKTLGEFGIHDGSYVIFRERI